MSEAREIVERIKRGPITVKLADDAATLIEQQAAEIEKLQAQNVTHETNH